MSLLLLLDGVPLDPAGTAASAPTTELRALLDALIKEDDRIGGRGVTRLSAPLLDTEEVTAFVESTIGFGESTDGTGSTRLLIDGEIIEVTGRTSMAPFRFLGLTRGAGNTEAKTHPAMSVVLDLSRNTSALSRLRRAFLVEFALLEDLQIIARNLGLARCPGVTEDQLRRIIKAVAYLPKSTIDAYLQALEALTGGVLDTDFTIVERIISDPWKVFIEIAVAIATDIKGRFFLNGGEPQLTTGLTSVNATYPLQLSPLGLYPGSPSQTIEGRLLSYPAGLSVGISFSVYDDTPVTRRGERMGFTDYAAGGSALGSVITLASSPGPIGTPVIIDYTAFPAHYLAANETVRQGLLPDDNYAYLADPLIAARCLLDQVRMAGVVPVVSTKL